MADEQIRIDVTATDDASKVLEDVADEAEALEKLTPEVVVGADVDQATRSIEEVSDDVKRLSRQDEEIVLRARIDDAKGALKALRTDLEQTADKADDTSRRLDKVGDGGGGGMKTRGNAIADLTGPLGEASSAASDFAGVFEGIGDIAEDVAGKVGVNAETMAGAIGGIGVAVAVGAAAWSYFSQKQAEARRKQEELVKGQRELNDTIAEGDLREAARQFQELYKGALAEADNFGVSVRDVTEYITGQSDALAPLIEEHDNFATAMGYSADQIQGARDAYDKANGSIAEQDRLLSEVQSGLTGATSAVTRNTAAQERAERQTNRLRDSFDRMRGALNFDQALLNLQGAFTRMGDNAQQSAEDTAAEVLDLKQAILDAAETAGASPIEVRTALQKISTGDLAGAKADAEGWFARNRPTATAAVKAPSTWELLAVKSFMGATIGTIQVPVVAVPRSGQAYG